MVGKLSPTLDWLHGRFATVNLAPRWNCGMCKEPYEQAGEVRGRPSLRVSEGLSGNSRETQPGSRTSLVDLRRSIRIQAYEEQFHTGVSGCYDGPLFYWCDFHGVFWHPWFCSYRAGQAPYQCLYVCQLMVCVFNSMHAWVLMNKRVWSPVAWDPPFGIPKNHSF